MTAGYGYIGRTRIREATAWLWRVLANEAAEERTPRRVNRRSERRRVKAAAAKRNKRARGREIRAIRGESPRTPWHPEVHNGC